jgi:large subunit ribosomal protein L29
MKYIDIIGQDKESLKTLLKEKKMLLFSLKNKLKLMQVSNTNELREVKKDIAKVTMAISQKEERKNA